MHNGLSSISWTRVPSPSRLKTLFSTGVNSTKTVCSPNLPLMPWTPLNLYHVDDKDDEIPASDIEGKVILAGESYRVNSCGRANASSGTEGSFDLVDQNGTAIRDLYWNCPWGKKTNVWRVTGGNVKWLLESNGANLNSGALGTITVTVVKLGWTAASCRNVSQFKCV